MYTTTCVCVFVYVAIFADVIWMKINKVNNYRKSGNIPL